MKFSIIINTHNQKKYLKDTIKTCLLQNFNSYEILIIDTSDRKFDNLPKKKKLKYYYIKKKYSQPELNQLHKILFGLKKSKGDYILLMDGDDKFKKNKLIYLNKLINAKKIKINQDLPLIEYVKKNKTKILKVKKYKRFKIFQRYINQWPQIYGTSSILIYSNILKKFFKKAKPFNWPLLAIDVQLLIFCSIFFKISYFGETLTTKKIHNNNLGEKYLSIFKKIFWIRRKMQYEYYFFLLKKRFFTLDYAITKLIYSIIK